MRENFYQYLCYYKINKLLFEYATESMYTKTKLVN